MSQLIADLRATRAIVERGWCRGYEASEDNHCLVGAMKVVTGSRVLGVLGAMRRMRQDPRFAALEKALIAHTPSVRALWMYNDGSVDGHRITQADVLNVIDKALAEAGGL